MLRLQLPAAGRRRADRTLPGPVAASAAGRGDAAAAGVSSSGAERDRPSVPAPAESDGALRLLPADVRRGRQRARFVPPRPGPARGRRRFPDVRRVRPADAGSLLPAGRPRGRCSPVQRRAGRHLRSTGGSDGAVVRRAVPLLLLAVDSVRKPRRAVRVVQRSPT